MMHPPFVESSTHAEHSHSLSTQVKEAEFRVASYDKLFKAAQEQELELKEELVILQDSSEATTRELEAQVAEGLLAERQARLVEVEAQLSHTEDLLHLVD